MAHPVTIKPWPPTVADCTAAITALTLAHHQLTKTGDDDVLARCTMQGPTAFQIRIAAIEDAIAICAKYIQAAASITEIRAEKKEA